MGATLGNCPVHVSRPRTLDGGRVERRLGTASQRWTWLSAIEAEAAVDAVNFHREVEGVDAGCERDVFGVDMTRPERERSLSPPPSWRRTGWSSSASRSMPNRARSISSAVAVSSVPFAGRSPFDTPGDHIRRVTESAVAHGSRGGRGTHQAGAPQACRRSGSNHASRARRGPLHEHAAVEIGCGDFHGRVGEVESIDAPTTILAHRQQVGVADLQRQCLVHGVDQEDVASPGSECVGGRGEGTENVNRHHGAGDVGDLPSGQEARAGPRSLEHLNARPASPERGRSPPDRG